MKKTRRRAIPLLLAALLVMSMVGSATFPVAQNDDSCEPCGPLVVDLLAGQDMKVGEVVVSNDDENVCVTYMLNEDALEAGWLLYETHLYVGATDDFPLSKPNKRLGEPYFANPIPGQFPYGDDELGGVPQWTFCISLEELGVEYCNELYVSAHAVVKRYAGHGDATSAVIYGNIGGYEATGQGDIWEIDPIDRSETKIFECPAGVDFAANWYPNALAYDEDNHRLYFTTSKNTLVFYDFSSYDDVAALTSAGTITNSNDVLGATFGDGAYWYILNQTNMLYRVDLDGAGKVTGLTSYAMPTGGVKLSQGDIVYEDGVIFGSSGTGAGGGDNLKGFFTYDIATGDFDVVYQGDSSFAAPQLAWGLDADGNKVLYGTLGGMQQTIWTIDTATWAMTPVTVAVDSDEPFVTENRYQDLASRFVYGEVWEDETAWGEGSRFNERGNWGMWFKYKVCEPEPECVEAQLLLNPGAEDGMTHWEFTENVVRSITQREQSTGMVYSRSGDYFFDFTGANVSAEGIGYAASMSQTVDVSGYEGCPYSAGGWIQTELWPDLAKTAIEDNDYGKFIVTFYDATNNELASFDTGIIGNPVQGSPATDGRQYAEFDLTGTVPVGADYAIYELEGYLIQGAFINVFYDDLYFWVGK